jgi:hypothetical protein
MTVRYSNTVVYLTGHFVILSVHCVQFSLLARTVLKVFRVLANHTPISLLLSLIAMEYE